MSNLVIVAIPEENDLVWKISSEKIPHMTMLFLGDSNKVQNQDKILEFVEHAAETTLNPFYLDIDYRGTLGEDDADVLFFRNGWDSKQVKNFRESLLKNDAVFKANIAVDQFPEWIPHLTLGYPKTPAKKLNDNQNFYSVCFDRIAFWVDNYEGPEFRLSNYDLDLAEVSMSTTIDDILAHHGVKGMKWGRRQNNTPTNVTLTKTKKGKVKTSGGKNQPTHSDAIVAKVAVQKAKKSGIESLSNDELRQLAKRLDLEQKVSKLADDQLTSNGEKLLNVLGFKTK